MFFSYSKKADELLTNQVKSSLIGAIACIIIPFVLLFMLDNNVSENQQTTVLGIFLLFAGLVIFEFSRTLRYAKIRGNLIKCEMVIHEDKVTGMYASNMEEPNSVIFFEVPMSDIRSVEILNFNLGPNKEYATLRIDHKNGSLKLLPDNPEKASSIIKEKIQK